MIPVQVFSCKICKIFKDTYFEEHLEATTSDVSKNGDKRVNILLVRYDFGESGLVGSGVMIVIGTFPVQILQGTRLDSKNLTTFRSPIGRSKIDEKSF